MSDLISIVLAPVRVLLSGIAMFITNVRVRAEVSPLNGDVSLLVTNTSLNRNVYISSMGYRLTDKTVVEFEPIITYQDPAGQRPGQPERYYFRDAVPLSEVERYFVETSYGRKFWSTQEPRLKDRTAKIVED